MMITAYSTTNETLPHRERGRTAGVPAPAGHHARRTLAVRAIAAQLGWLDAGVPHWKNDRVAWRLPHGGDFLPEPADLSRAQKLIYKTRQYPVAGIAVFGDPAAWRAAMQTRLALAARLRTLRASADDAGLPTNAARLLALLPAEALCVSGAVPGPPSPALIALARAGRLTPEIPAALAGMAEDADLPPAARLLAALTLGAILRERERGERTTLPPPSLSAPTWDIYRRGLRRGLPRDPSLTAALSAAGGEDFAARGERVSAEGESESRSPFPLPLGLLREALLTGRGDAEEILAVTELLEEQGGAISRRLRDGRQEIAGEFGDKDKRREAHGACREEAQRIRAARADAARKTARNFEKLLRNSAGKTALVPLAEQVLRFADALLTVSPPSVFVLETLRDALDRCLRLPPSLRADLFALAVERKESIWAFPNMAKRVRAHPTGDAFGRQVLHHWHEQGNILVTLLTATGDGALLREGLGLELYYPLQGLCEAGADSDHLRLLIRLVKQFDPHHDPDTPEDFRSGLRWALADFAAGAIARDALQPLAAALSAAAREDDRRPAARLVLSALLNANRGESERMARVFPRLAAIAPAFLRWAETASPWARDEYDYTIAEAAYWLADACPDELPAFLETVIALVPTERPGAEETPKHPFNLRAVRLAAHLAGGDRAAFAALLPLAVPATRDEDSAEREWLDKGIPLLKRFSSLVPTLAALLPTEPRRCLALLCRIGRASQLGPDVLAPLADADFVSQPDRDASYPAAETDDANWQTILDLAPDFAPPVADFWRAQWLLGARPDVPPGIRRIVEERERRATELAYLEALCETKSAETAPGLFARRNSLRVRVETGGVRDDTLAEVRERLKSAVVQARMAFIEQQAALCCRERLRQAVGPLPSGFTLTPDMENATLLSFTITVNRKPLLKLLRARVHGEADPFRDHPANVAFREQLREAGADVETWLSAFPRRLRAGEKSLSLALETDPLHVLQMGNYFDTCLSAGSGVNAFSTVANALEQNKRVLYVRDGSGRVIARKLIGITKDGGLIGFYTYCSLSDAEGAPAVRAAVRRYVTDFAAACRLSMTEGGVVPTLFAESWYDDGSVAWDDGSSGGDPEKSLGENICIPKQGDVA